MSEIGGDLGMVCMSALTHNDGEYRIFLLDETTNGSFPLPIVLCGNMSRHAVCTNLRAFLEIAETMPVQAVVQPRANDITEFMSDDTCIRVLCAHANS